MSTVAIRNPLSAPLGMFGCVWNFRYLISLLTLRGIEVRFRGSLLGKLWAVLTPLFMLALYTFVFGVVLKVKWAGEPTGTFDVALLYFTGLIISDFFFECLTRATTLMVDHVIYIKKVVFPLEVLAWVSVGEGLFRVGVSAIILFVFYIVIDGLPPPSAILLPLVVAPLALVAVGFIWYLSMVGVFVRDIRHLIGLIAPAVMFLSPIFYPLSAVPEPFRNFLYLNPLTLIAEQVRAVLFHGMMPDWGALAVYTAVAWLFAGSGYFFFMRARMGIADVI